MDSIIKLKQELDNGGTIILEKEMAFELIELLVPNIVIPWIYNFAKAFKFYKIEDEYIVEPSKKKGGI